MKAFLLWLRRQRLELTLATLQAEYNADRENFDWLCQKLSADRRAIAAAQHELAGLEGHQASVHQLRPR